MCNSTHSLTGRGDSRTSQSKRSAYLIGDYTIKCNISSFHVKNWSNWYDHQNKSVMKYVIVTLLFDKSNVWFLCVCHEYSRQIIYKKTAVVGWHISAGNMTWTGNTSTCKRKWEFPICQFSMNQSHWDSVLLTITPDNRAEITEDESWVLLICVIQSVCWLSWAEFVCVIFADQRCYFSLWEQITQ